tara:strand:+ start:45 stop:665 length:621 start_codon:yes stop_codon:yes gene_type:complete
MRVEYFNNLEKFPYIIIDELYDDDEISELWEELDYLCNPRRLIESSIDNGAAHEADGTLLKFNHCQYLDNMYMNREQSTILQVTEKIFMNDRKIFEDHPHWFFKDLTDIDQHYTQVVYYEDKDEYRAHRDKSTFTCLTWFYRKPKKYSGGDMYFPAHDVTVECLNNRTLIFPSIIEHQVLPVKMESKDLGQKYGRFCIAQLLSSKF